MITETSFIFGNLTINIQTLKKFKDADKAQIQFLVDILLMDLNHNIPNSSAFNFNKGQPLMSIFVKPEFIQYFSFVFNLMNQFKDTFSPFNLEGISDFNIQTITKEHFTIDLQDNVIIKNINFEFDSSYFRNIFILEYISELLKEKEIEVYLIKLDDLFIGQGIKGWIVQKESAKAHLVNRCAYAFEYSPSGFKTFKFGAADNDLKPSQAILLGDSLAKLRILAPQVNYINTRTDMKKFCEENEVEFVT